MNHYALAMELTERLAEHVPVDDPFLVYARHALTLPPGNCFKRGENNPAAVLTPDDVRRMRAMRRDGKTYPQLAKHYGMSTKQIWRICNHQQWAWVND